MSSHWGTLPFGDLTRNFDSLRVPVRQADRQPGPYPYYGASGVVDHVNSYIFDGEYLLIAEDGENLRTRNTPVAFLARGKFWVNNHAHIVQGNDRADTRFLMYALNQAEISGYLTGSAMPKLTQQNINRIPLPAPPLSEQRAIASILGTLDDKIELNRRMNETLEAIARAQFRSWFIDFDPVRAKMEGRQPLGMDEAMAALFPSLLVADESGPIPTGWHFGSLGDIANNPRRGIAPEHVQTDAPYIGLEHMPRRSIALTDWGNAIGIQSGKFKFRAGDILFGKLRPYFHKVGVAPVDGVCSTDILVIEPRAPIWFGLTLGIVSSDEFVAYTDRASAGTKMPRTNWADMSRYPIVCPPPAVAREFSVQISALCQRIRANILQSRTIRSIRDMLLPKLLSGEVQPIGAGQISKR